MRIRNNPNSREILNNSRYVILEPEHDKGNWNQVFKNDNPIDVEIGMGKGRFILESAVKFPYINFIGIEKNDTIAAKAVSVIEGYTLPNLRIIVMDANHITDIFDKEINRIYLNFCDPWPKEKHAKRRLTSDTFLEQFEQIFKSAKEIRMKTDNEKLFIYSVETLNNHGYKIKSNYNKDDDEDLEETPITEYEEKFIKKNNYIYKLEASKK